MRPASEVLTALLDGPARRFADPIVAEVPTSGVGIYTLSDEGGKLVYVGVAGRDPDGAGLARNGGSSSSGLVPISCL
jgi:hypothetical protein